MPDLIATRTLVKSPPELWEELSDIDGLTRHLGEFGEIEIRRVEPERSIAWEAERASGTVEIEASSWGTKVVLTAELPETEPEEPAAGMPEPEPEPQPREEPPRIGFFARWLFRERRALPEPEMAKPPRMVEPADAAEPGLEAADPASTPSPLDEERARVVLEGTLDTLGSAHHRPFSRG